MNKLWDKLYEIGIDNRDLRSCFDPYSTEFSNSSFEKRIQKIKKVIINGFSLHEVINAYCKYYKDNEKPYVEKDISTGLCLLINDILQVKTSFQMDEYDDEHYEIYKREELLTLLVDVLIALLKNEKTISIEAKYILYGHLVNKRKKHNFHDEKILNPSQIEGGKYDGEHLNPLAYWHWDLNAKILLIGQDFSDEAYFIKNKGKDEPRNPTNVSLKKLFEHIGMNIGTTEAPNTNENLYFTNAILGIKKGGMAAKINKKWYLGTGFKLIKPLINLIQPKIIITLGSAAYETICSIYSVKCEPLKNIVEKVPTTLSDGKLLFAFYHCSNNSINRNRKFERQLEDWEKIKPYLN